MSTRPSSARPRLLNAPKPIEVVIGERDEPVAVVTAGVERQVVEVVEQWRLDEGWWRPNPISRHYWLVQLDDGRLVTVFRDLVGESWWTQHA